MNSNKTSLTTFVIPVITVGLAAFLSYIVTKKTIKYEIQEQKVYEISRIKDRFISDVELFGETARSIAEYEFGTNFANKPYVEEYEKFYQKLFDLGLVNILYDDIAILNSENFDLFLSKFDDDLHSGYKTLELSKNNPDITKAKKAHLVYQLFFENKLREDLNRIKESDIRNYYIK